MVSALAPSINNTVVSVSSFIGTEKGNHLYREFFKPAIDEVYNNTSIWVPLAWIITPYLYLSSSELEKISIEDVKELCNFAVEKVENNYQLTDLQNYIDKVLTIEKFKHLSAEDLLKFIDHNIDSEDIVHGNIPDRLDDYKKLNLVLPIKDWVTIYDVGLYDPFETGKLTMHYGMDIAISSGTDLYAVFDGKVTAKYYDNIGGNQVIISHDTLHVLYAHMQSPTSLDVGDKVTAGTAIGKSGATGNVTGPHLHFQACAIDTLDTYNGCVVNQEKTFFNPRLLWDFSRK